MSATDDFTQSITKELEWKSLSSRDPSYLVDFYYQYEKLMKAISQRNYDAASHAAQSLSTAENAVHNTLDKKAPVGSMYFRSESISTLLYDVAARTFKAQAQEKHT
jgi:hypothetical protein